MRFLRCLMVSLLVYPALATTATPESDVRATNAPQAAPVAPATPATPAAPAPDAVQERRALLEQRVIAKWDALIRRDFATAYSFTSPSYRKLFSQNAFQSSFGNKVAWRRVEVVDVDFKGDDAATVGINIHFVYAYPQAEKPLDMKTYVQEPWVRVDGQWWYLMKE